ncbi:MAG: ABC transporter substrate-binding protein, partial [Pseudomonadota bacterium]
ITVQLNPAAVWSDGTPVTSRDVAFTIETLQTQGAPFYRQALKDVATTILSDREIEIRAATPGDRDFIGRIGRIPIQSSAYWSAGDVAAATETPPPGSGPYLVEDYSINRFIKFRRNPNYWGQDLPVNRGRWNFDEINIQYIRSQDTALEAFLADDVDFRIETNAQPVEKHFAQPAVSDGRIQKETRPLDNFGRSVSLIYNLRRKPFDDIRVRRALALVYPSEFVLNTIFGGAFDPHDGAFGGTVFEAQGRAADTEWAIIAASLSDADAGLRETPSPGAAEASQRERLLRASELLDEAGLEVADGRRLNPDGEPWVIDAIYTRPVYDRALSAFANNLERLGIELRYRALEPASGAQRLLAKDFDVTLLSWTLSRTPGLAEGLLWGSALADMPRSYALAGVRDPALDAAITAMQAARDADSQSRPSARP